jgi:hypothetical protein
LSVAIPTPTDISESIKRAELPASTRLARLSTRALLSAPDVLGLGIAAARAAIERFEPVAKALQAINSGVRSLLPARAQRLLGLAHPFAKALKALRDLRLG